MDLVAPLMWVEMAAFAALAIWMSLSVWQSARGNGRTNDSIRFIVATFSYLIVYRDFRIRFVDDSDGAKVIMCVVGILLCAFVASAMRAYGRGAKL